MTEPVLTKRIPSVPWGDPAQRHTVWLEESLRTGGYAMLEQVLAMDPAAVVAVVKDAELRGRGGAGFPCGLKWTFLPESDGGRRYLAVNCDEAEPCTFKDRVLVDGDPHLVLEGIAIACWACRLDTAWFFIRGEYCEQIEIMERAIAEAVEHGVFGPRGLLGGTVDHAVAVHLHVSAGAYICGEETALLEAIAGRRAWPYEKPPFPAVEGLFGRPTIVNNVETLAALPSILEHGADWWQGMGCASSVGGPGSYGPKLMGISGHVERPGCVEVDLGIPLRTLVEDHCGGMRGGRAFKGAIAGGVSMGVLGPDEFDAPMDFDIGTRFGVMGLGTACPTILDETTDMVAVARNIARFFRNESCGQCTPCREGTQWMLAMLQRLEAGDATGKDLDLLVELASSMGVGRGTTICGLADGADWGVRTIVEKFRPEFEARVRPSRATLATADSGAG